MLHTNFLDLCDLFEQPSQTNSLVQCSSHLKLLIDLLSGLFDLSQLLIGAVFTLTYMPAASMYPLMTMKYFQGTVSQAGLIEAIYSTGMLIVGTIIGLFGKWQDRMKPVIIAFFLVGIPTDISGILPGNQTGFL